jgi:type II secretory pathway component GspD/PulD (secretin)
MQTRHPLWRHSTRLGLLILAGVVVASGAACSSSRGFQKGTQAAMRGDWDLAVDYYTTAVQTQPNRVDYRMALERAQIAASQIHFDKARDLERRDSLDAALADYRKVIEYYPANQEARAKVAALEQTIRARVEAARPKPAIDALREQARKSSPEPMLNPKSRDAIDFTWRGQLREILIGMGNVAGITVNFDRDFQEKTYSVEFKNISFLQALQQVATANTLFYKVIGDNSIIIIPDQPAKRQAYEEQAIQTFYISNADTGELMTLISAVARVQQAVQPVIQAGKTSNTIIVRASVSMMQIIERLIKANDKPRAEIVIDVEILEVNRNRAKQFGLELSQYQIGATFSPESAPSGTTSGTGTSGTAAATSSSGAFNLNTITKGISPNDFYASVPQAVIKFLESDINTKVIAKPQLRGSEGEALSLNLGEEVPVPSTTFTPMVTGGTAYNPMTSFQYKNVGVNVEMKPRVTFEGDVVIELKLEVSAQGPDKNIAGQNLPSFTSRKVGTKLRLRDGESNLLAGLLREDERTSLKGLPGTLHIPLLSHLFASNDTAVSQTDIVMLLTPHIVRTHELTVEDLMPIYIGTQQNLGLSSAPPTIGQNTEPAAAAPPAAPAAVQGALTPGAVVPGPPGSTTRAVIPPGSSPIPGTVGVPIQPAAPQNAPKPPPTVVRPPASPVATAPVVVAPPQPAQPTQSVAKPAVPPQQGPPAQAAQPVIPPSQAVAKPAVSPQQTPPAQPAQPVTPPSQAAAAKPVAPVPPPVTAPVTAPPTVAVPQPGIATQPPAAAPKADERAQVVVGAPTAPMQVAGGPYTVPFAIAGASKISTISLSITFNPKVLRVRLPQEGDFMRKGGAKVTFTYKVDEAVGRVDVTVTRASDTTGASGDGVVLGVIFDAIGVGASPVGVAGVATAPGGALVPLQFMPATVTVK